MAVFIPHVVGQKQQTGNREFGTNEAATGSLQSVERRTALQSSFVLALRKEKQTGCRALPPTCVSPFHLTGLVGCFARTRCISGRGMKVLDRAFDVAVDNGPGVLCRANPAE
jgi:hypothetical protein